jgi:tripartite-type tricarboxylate transporter receptor subunit TctC
MLRHSLKSLSLVSLSVVALSALAQDFPSKPIRMIVAQPPGLVPDLVARVMVPEMSKLLGQPIVVENRPGAGGITGYEYVAKQAPADGYSIAVVTVSALAGMPVLTKDLRFDPVKDLPPFSGLIQSRLVFGSSTTLPWKTLNEMVTHAKANPGKLNFGSPNPQILLVTTALTKGLGIEVVNIPYSSGGPYNAALASGEIQMGFTSEATAVAMGGKFRALAVTGRSVSPAYPEAPTFTQVGFPQIPGGSTSLNARGGTPNAIVEKLHSAAARALQNPEVQTQFAKLQMEIVNESPSLATKRLADEVTLYTEIAKKIGFQPE